MNNSYFNTMEIAFISCELAYEFSQMNGQLDTIRTDNRKSKRLTKRGFKLFDKKQ